MTEHQVQMCGKVYVNMIMAMHLAGVMNAYERFASVYGAGDLERSETDVQYVRRNAERDYEEHRAYAGRAVFPQVLRVLQGAVDSPVPVRVRCTEKSVALLKAVVHDVSEYSESEGMVTVRATLENLATLADFSADFEVFPGWDSASPQPIDARYGAVRVPTECGGLQPISMFDAVEIEEMIADPATGDLTPGCDDRTATPVAVSVRLHYRRGGVDTVADFHFDPAEPGAKWAAEKSAHDLGTMLSDMILAADPSLGRSYVIGNIKSPVLSQEHAASAIPS